MCGVFGFITHEDHGPDVHRLRRLAAITQSRGEDAFGLAWIDREGRMHTFKRPGPATDHLEALDACRHARAVIGHCRYATHGSPADNRNNHPHAAGRGFIVHNGVVHNAQDLLRRHGLRPTSQCDSEVLALLIARAGGQIVRRAARAANDALGEMAILGLWTNPVRLLICRRGKPLHYGLAPEGYYFASLEQGLPDEARAVADRSARVIACAGGRLALAGPTIRLE